MAQLASLAALAVVAGCAPRPSHPPGPPASGGCSREAIEHVIAPQKARLQSQLDRAEYPLPGGDRDLRRAIADLDQKSAGCLRGDGDACQGLAVEGDARELMSCAVDAWRRDCAAASARSCLRLSDVYSATYYMPSLRPFPADPGEAAALYTRGTGLYQQACDRGDVATCRTMAFEPTVMAKEPARAVALLVRLCDGGDGQACSDAAAHPAGDPKQRTRLLERACFAPQPWGLACKMLADLPESEPRAAELRARACTLDARTCPHPRRQPPP